VLVVVVAGVVDTQSGRCERMDEVDDESNGEEVSAWTVCDADSKITQRRLLGIVK
jgi:hypothetical protein